MAFGDFVTGQSAKKDAGSTTSSTLAYPGNVTAGNLLICVVRQGGTPGTVTISDNLNGTWPAADDTRAVTNSGQMKVFHFANSAGGACTVTVTFGTSNTMRFVIGEYVGSSSVSIDAATPQFGAANSTSPSSGAATTTHTCLLIGACIGENAANVTGYSAGSGQTLRQSIFGPTDFAGPALQDWNGAQVAGTYTATATLTTTNENWGMTLLAYYNSAAAGGPDTNQHLLQQAPTFGTNPGPNPSDGWTLPLRGDDHWIPTGAPSDYSAVIQQLLLPGPGPFGPGFRFPPTTVLAEFESGGVPPPPLGGADYVFLVPSPGPFGPGFRFPTEPILQLFQPGSNVTISPPVSPYADPSTVLNVLPGPGPFGGPGFRYPPVQVLEEFESGGVPPAPLGGADYVFTTPAPGPFGPGFRILPAPILAEFESGEVPLPPLGSAQWFFTAPAPTVFGPGLAIINPTTLQLFQPGNNTPPVVLVAPYADPSTLFYLLPGPGPFGPGCRLIPVPPSQFGQPGGSPPFADANSGLMVLPGPGHFGPGFKIVPTPPNQHWTPASQGVTTYAGWGIVH